MMKIPLARLHQGHRTIKFPEGPPPAMPDRFRGRPVIDTTLCPEGCRACAQACPTGAITLTDKAQIDLGKCLFCTDCLEACPPAPAPGIIPTPGKGAAEGAGKAIRYSSDYRLTVRQRQELVIDQDRQEIQLAQALGTKLRRLLGRSLKLRQVSAGGCNACEADVNVLGTVGWDIGRFGIQMVASPRHADGLLITGPVTQNMKLALHKTYAAVPSPKIVIAVGACAISGGPYLDHVQVHNGADAVVPVDLYIPGCPPHPLTILDGLLRLLGRIRAEEGAPSGPVALGG